MQAAQGILRVSSSQEPAVIEPGALIIWVSEEGILYQLQFFEEHILGEASLGSRVWLGVQLGQETGAVMPGGVVGEVSGDEAVGEG